MIWARTKEWVFEVPIAFLLHEGNIIAAKIQKQIYTYHKWRERQCGVGHWFYQVQKCSPPSLQEPKVEEIFHEFPCWRVTHFVWMIAWGWRLHMGMMVPNIFQIPSLDKASRPHIVASMDIPLVHDEIHLDFSPKAYLYTWEEQLGDLLMRQHLVHWRNLSYEDATGGRGEALQLYPCTCLRTSNIWE